MKLSLQGSDSSNLSKFTKVNCSWFQWLGEQLKKFLPLAVCYSLWLEFTPSLLSTLLHHWGRLILWVLLNQLWCTDSLCQGCQQEHSELCSGTDGWMDGQTDIFILASPVGTWRWRLLGLFPLDSQEVIDHTLLPTGFILSEQGLWPQCEQAAPCLVWIFCWL